ncbi:MAG TPA: sigma-70 family RNA polymerase sigma factor [Mycobacteriales bacterium]|nr:sigma-70 family RNA polymerase sigma factor [Mycobacteriales bacterium]
MSEPQVRRDPAWRLLALYDTALPDVYGYLLSRCRDRSLAEELTSETFLAAVTEARRERVHVSVPWLIGVARHKLADHWRRAAREERGLRLVADAGRPEDPWDAQLDALLAEQILARLAAPHRAALTLRYLDGLPVPEVAAYLDRSVRATESLLARARSAFRAHYEKGGAGDE